MPVRAPAGPTVELVSSAAPSSRCKLVLTGAATLAAMIALAVLFVPRAREVMLAATNVPWWAFVLTIILGVASLLLRAEVWGVCLGACGKVLPRRDVHAANSFGMLANGFNHYAGPAVRIGALRRLMPDAPRPAQMVAADLPVLLAEAGLLVLLLGIGATAAGIAWYVPVSAAAGCLALVCGLWMVRNRFAHRPATHGLNVLLCRRSRHRMLALITVAVGFQVLRTWLLLEGVGLDPSFWQVAMTFIATGLLGVLPLGPTTSSGATLAVFGAQSATAAAAAGLVLTASAFAAAALYAGWGAVALLRRVGRKPFAALRGSQMVSVSSPTL